MDWFNYSLQITVLVTSIWILKKIFIRPKCNKTKNLEINDDFTGKNKVNKRIYDESSSENSCLNSEKLKDSLGPSKFIDKTDSYEDEERYETCNNASYTNDNQEKIDITNVMEYSGYGTNEEEMQNVRLNTSDKSQHYLDTHNSLLKTVPRAILRKSTNSIVLYNVSFESEIDLQNSNLESTEDEGNESQIDSSEEDLKRKTFFTDRKYKNLKRFTSNEIGNFENNENAQSLSTEMNTRGSYQDTRFTYTDESQIVSDANSSYSSSSLPSSIHANDISCQNMQISFEENNYDVSFMNSTASDDEMNFAFVENDTRQE